VSNMSRVICSKTIRDITCWEFSHGVFVQTRAFNGALPAYGIWYINSIGERGPCWIIFGSRNGYLCYVPGDERYMQETMKRHAEAYHEQHV